MANQVDFTHHEIVIHAAHPNVHQPDKSRLDLSDNGNTVAKAGDTVSWIVNDPSITSIIVMDDNKLSNVFSPDPKPVGGGTKNWTGRTKPVIHTQVESYTICWAQNGQVYCYDPQIVVNP
jgi:plastocyanin